MSSSLQVEIRPMAAGDVDGVMEIAASLPSAPHWPRKAWMDALDPNFKPTRIALVAVQPEPLPTDLLGFIVASLLVPQAELEIIAVASQSQRRGLGRILLAALTVQLTQAEITEIYLEVRTTNQAAIGLYRKFGFKQCGVRERYYADPIEDAVIMSLQLSAGLEA